MSGTAFLGIVEGLCVALEAVPAHAGVRVYRNRNRPIGASEARAIFVRLQGSRRDPAGPLGAADWQTAVQVEVAARGTTGVDPAHTVDALLASSWVALLGAPLALPDVVDLDAEPSIEWADDGADTPIGSATFSLVVRHRTEPNTLTPWSA